MCSTTLDRYDIKILAHLQREGRCSNVELSAAVGLSESPCLARTKRLQDTGIIRGYGADVVLEKLGDYILVFTEVTISNHRPEDFRQFESGIAKYPEIIDCYNLSGGYDYLLKLVVPSISYLQELTEQLFKIDIGIEKFTSRIVLRQPLKQRSCPLDIIITGKRNWDTC